MQEQMESNQCWSPGAETAVLFKEKHHVIYHQTKLSAYLYIGIHYDLSLFQICFSENFKTLVNPKKLCQIGVSTNYTV